jgi:hypothetical protein
MSFRVWYYLCILAFPVLVPALVCGRLAGESRAWAVVGTAALWSLIALGVTGAVLAVLMMFCGLRMRCPFCGGSGDFGGNREMGPTLVCDWCGLVQGSGFLKLRLVRQWENGPPAEYEDDDEGDDEEVVDLERDGA